MNNKDYKIEWAPLNKAFLALYSNVAVSNVEKLYEEKGNQDFSLLKNLVNHFSHVLRSDSFQKKLNKVRKDYELDKYFEIQPLDDEDKFFKFTIKKEVFKNILKVEKIINPSEENSIKNISQDSSLLEFLRLIRNYYAHKPHFKEKNKEETNAELISIFQETNTNIKFLKIIFEIYFCFENRYLNDELFHLIYLQIFLTRFEIKNFLQQMQWNLANDKIKKDNEKLIVQNWSTFFNDFKISLSKIRFSFKNPKNNMDYEEKAFAILKLLDQALHNKTISKKILAQYTSQMLNKIFQKEYEIQKKTKIEVRSTFHIDTSEIDDIFDPWLIRKKNLDEYDIDDKNIVGKFHRNYIQFILTSVKDEKHYFMLSYNCVVKLIYRLKVDYKNVIKNFIKDCSSYIDFKGKRNASEHIEKIKSNFNDKTFKILQFKKQPNIIVSKGKKGIDYKSFINAFEPAYISDKNNNIRRSLKVINNLYSHEFKDFLSEDKHRKFKSLLYKGTKEEIIEELYNWKIDSNETNFVDDLISEFEKGNVEGLQNWEVLNQFIRIYFRNEESYIKYINRCQKVYKEKIKIQEAKNISQNKLFTIINHEFDKNEMVLQVKPTEIPDNKKGSQYDKSNKKLKKQRKVLRKFIPLLNIFKIYKNNFENTINNNELRKIDWIEKKLYLNILIYNEIKEAVLNYMDNYIYIRKEIALKDLLESRGEEGHLINDFIANFGIFNSLIYRNYKDITKDLGFRDEIKNNFKILDVYIKKRELHFIKQYLYIDKNNLEMAKENYFRNKVFHRLKHKKEINFQWRKDFVKKHLLFKKQNRNGTSKNK